MDAYVKYFRYRSRNCLCHTRRRQRGGDAGGFPTLAQPSYEKPLDRCPPGGWVLVSDPALHHGLRHESETCWFGDNRSSAYAPGSAHCARVSTRPSASVENIDRTHLQA